MRRILLVLLTIFFIQDSVAQIDSVSIQGIDCYNDTAFIKIDLSPNSFILEYDSWEYQPYDDTNWYFIDTNSYSINSTYDTLFSNQCGKHRVTVFDQTIFSLIEYIFFIPCPVTVGLGQLEKIKCFGSSDGVLIAPTFGGVVFDPDSSVFDSLGVYSPNDTTGDEYYTYQWFKASNLLGANLQTIGDSTNILNNVSAGFYSVEVTDALGCVDTLNFSDTLFTWVNNPYPLIIDTLMKGNISCYGGSDGYVKIAVNGGRKFHSNRNYFYYILDSNNDTIYRNDNLVISSNFSQLSTLSDSSLVIDSILFDNLQMGSYNIVVVDSFGCILDTSFSLTEPNPFEAFTTELTPLNCINDSIWFFIDSVTGGQGTQNYYWLESNSMSDSIYVGEGDYTIIIEDTVFGCFDTLLANCEADFEISNVVTIEDVACYGNSTGSITLNSLSGGASPYQWMWVGFTPTYGTDSVLDNLVAGTYILNVKDSLCTQMFYFDIVENNSIYATSTIVEPSCNGLSDGSIEILANGGQSPYNYNWLNGTGSANLLFGLPIGNYTLIIEDDLGCTDTSSFTLTEPDSLNLEFDNFNNPLQCYGGLTAISALITGGTGPFSFLWTNTSTISQTVVGAGFWTCEVTDNNGCFVSNNILITEPDEFFISDSIFTNPLCADGGSASIETSGGTSPVSYIWSTGETTQAISNLLVNFCWVIATDSCGNTDSVGFNLTPYELITSVEYNDSIHLSQVIISPLSSGLDFTYEWFNIYDLSTVVANGSDVINLCEGTYLVRTTDLSNDCFVEDTLIVNFYLLSAIVDLEITTVLPDSNLWGFGPYTYLWGPSSGLATQQANICPGDHWLEVTDNYGCKVDTFFTIEVITIDLDPIDELIECDLENLDLELSVFVSGGTDPYTYLWSNGGTDSTTNLALSPGPLAITVMDNNACTLDTLFTITAMTEECVPNVFTPNNDLVNDFWNLEQAFIYSDTEIKVYGRFGREIFESVGYENPWDGKNKKGNDVPAGVYFYHIELGHGYSPIKGTVTILR